MADDDEIPEYLRPHPMAPMEMPVQQPVDAERTGLERALSDYSSPGEGRSSLIGMLGATGVDSGLPGGAQTSAGGGGAGALMLPMLLAQMQQRQAQASSPLSAFANAYAGATGQRSPLQSQAPSQYQQFQMIHGLMQDKALQEERDARLGIAQKAQDRLEAKAADDRIRRGEEQVLKNANFQVAEGKKLLTAGRGPLSEMGAANVLAGYKKLGIQVGADEEAVFQALSNGVLTHKDTTELVADMDRKIPDDVLLTRRGVTPEVLAGLRVKGGALEQLAGDNQVKRRENAAKADLEEAKVINEQNPEFAKEPKLIPFIMARARDKFGVPYQKLEPDQKAAVMRMAQTDFNADALQQYGAQQKLMLGREQALAGTHMANQVKLAQIEQKGIYAPIGGDAKNIWVNRDTGKPASGDEMYLTQQEAQKRNLIPLSPQQAQQEAGYARGLSELQTMKATHDEMKKRGLYSTQSGLLAPFENLYKGTIAPKITQTDGDRAVLRNFNAQKTAMINLDRTMNTLGVRAFGAFEPQLQVLSPEAGAQAVELTMSQMEQALRAQGTITKLGQARDNKTIWEPPVLKGGPATPPSQATGAVDVTKAPVSKMTVETFRARALAKYPYEEAMQKINEFMQDKRITD